jgi:hypothetical protein
MFDQQSPDVVLFFDDVAELPPVDRRGALRVLTAKTRVVLLAAKTSPLVTYAAGLGVRDFVFLPAEPAKILHRVEHPALPEEAANILGGVKLPEDGKLPEKKQAKRLEKEQDESPEKEKGWFSFAKLIEQYKKRKANKQLQVADKHETTGAGEAVGRKPAIDIDIDCLRSTLEKAQKGTRRAGKAVYVYTALSLQMAELALWGVFFVALGLGLVYTAGWVCQEAGWTEGLCKVVITLSHKIAGIAKGVKGR